MEVRRSLLGPRDPTLNFFNKQPFHNGFRDLAFSRRPGSFFRAGRHFDFPEFLNVESIVRH